MFSLCCILGVLLAETYASTCLEGELSCSNNKGPCILKELWCNGYIDCEDGSDEQFCDTSNRNAMDRTNTQLSVVEAIHYLLVQRKFDYGWDEFTPRALVALAFGQKHLPIPENDKSLMTKRLDLQLLLLLKKEVQNLATLAHNINALYALCKDPRNFHGLDLVELLRSKTDEAMKSDFNLPIVFLTLCLANETRPGDFDNLLRIYEDERNSRIGVKALTLIAMFTCSLNGSEERNRSEMKMRDFIQLSLDQELIDVQSKALICQAYNAYGYDTSSWRKDLISMTQSEDGSFGDLIGTYSAIPALLNLSLADLQCKTRHYEVRHERGSISAQIIKPESQIDYSLWISEGEKAGNHTLRLSYEGEKTFYDLMKVAELKNQMYRFKYELQGTGKKIYYLAGIPNDAEKGYIWNLYRSSHDIWNSMSVKQADGVDRIYPTDGDHFIFQLEQKM